MIFKEIKQISSYEILEELRLISNVFKHGTGSSWTDLVKRNTPIIRCYDENFSEGSLIRPFNTSDIELTSCNYLQYHEAVKSFLEDVFIPNS